MNLRMFGLVVFSFAALTFISPTHSRLLADERLNVESTTKPYHADNLVGTEQITIETFEKYRLRTVIVRASEKAAPTDHWLNQRYVAYLTKNPQRPVGQNKIAEPVANFAEPEEERLKWADLKELTDKKAGIKKQVESLLWWYDAIGHSFVTLCNAGEHINGSTFVDNTLIERKGASGRMESGSGVQISLPGSAPGEPEFQVLSVDNGTATWHKVDSKPKDTTGCDDPKFPFLFLKEKPL